MKTKLIHLHWTLVFSFILLNGNGLLAQNFTKIEEGPHVTDGWESLGCAWGDYDNDGDEDLFVANGLLSGYRNYLFRNDGPDNFIMLEEGNIVNDAAPSRGASWGDYDNDGDLDLVVANQMGINYNYLYQNNGDGNFIRITEGEIAYDFEEGEPIGWFDYDKDGYLDVFVGNPVEPNGLYRNTGDGKFARVYDDPLAMDNGTGSFGWCDFDNDRDFDILVGYWLSTVGALFVNDGKNNFTKISEGMVLNDAEDPLSGGNWVDFDNDGDWDIIKIGHAIYRNEGPDSNYKFTKITDEALITDEDALGISCWADIDNDGDIDCYITNMSDINVGKKNSLYTNNGDGTFTPVTDGVIVTDSLISVGSAWADYDNDGDMDVYVCNSWEDNNALYRNDNGNGNNWIKIKLVGVVSNATAIGAILKVKANTGAGAVWQMRSIQGQSSLLGQNSLIAHFGLGTASIIDSLVILWPAGHDTVITGVSVNQLLNITENIPDNYLRAAFEADTTFGMNELSVQFTDKSLFDPGNPITSWSWDFNGDGTEDSDEQNPEYTFSAANGEIYTIRLIVSNGINTDTLYRTNLIRVLPEEGNLALLGKATASSEEDILFNPQKSIDGSVNTPWKSLKTDSEWLKIELSSIQMIGKVVTHWGSGYGKQYSIQSSVDDLDWNTVFVECLGDGGIDTIKFTGVDAKYLKWEGIVRSSFQAYIIKELEIYLSDGNTYEVNTDQCTVGVESNLDTRTEVNVFPNPAESFVTINFDQQLNQNTFVELTDITGRFHKKLELATGSSRTTIDVSGLPDGIYFLSVRFNHRVYNYKIVKY